MAGRGHFRQRQLLGLKPGRATAIDSDMAREVPILMSAPMVLASLADRKTETRRLLYTERSGEIPTNLSFLNGHFPPMASAMDKHYALSGWHAVKPGERLWVREAWRTFVSLHKVPPRDLLANGRGAGIAYAAGGGLSIGKAPERERTYDDRDRDLTAFGRVRAGMHMPRWACRLLLDVKSVRIERLQEIDVEGAYAEGIERVGYRDYRAGDLARATDPIGCYQALWWALHGIGSWNTNPEVVVLRYERFKGDTK